MSRLFDFAFTEDEVFRQMLYYRGYSEEQIQEWIKKDYRYDLTMDGEYLHIEIMDKSKTRKGIDKVMDAIMGIRELLEEVNGGKE